ncbi:hypothetical protein Pelo_18888 [Pelomyxa schiedti]|nr:hypothetical protein Pelo_18888 [Pelomyxa schiedti]
MMEALSGWYLIPPVCDLGLQVCVISCDAARQHIIIASVSYKSATRAIHNPHDTGNFYIHGSTCFYSSIFGTAVLMGNMIGGFTPINSIKHYKFKYL